MASLLLCVVSVRNWSKLEVFLYSYLDRRLVGLFHTQLLQTGISTVQTDLHANVEPAQGMKV